MTSDFHSQIVDFLTLKSGKHKTVFMQVSDPQILKVLLTLVFLSLGLFCGRNFRITAFEYKLENFVFPAVFFPRCKPTIQDRGRGVTTVTALLP